MRLNELKLLPAMVSFAAAAVCIGCTSELKVGEGDLDMTITVGGDSLMIPVGSTKAMGIGDFIDLDTVDFIEVDGQGNYFLKMTDTFEEEVSVSDRLTRGSSLCIPERLESVRNLTLLRSLRICSLSRMPKKMDC